jgi:hypothetical protein
MKKSRSKSKKEEVAMTEGINVQMIDRKLVLCFGNKIVGKIESLKVHDTAQPAANTAANEKPPEQRFTLEEAFTYDGQTDYASDTVKGVFAVSFLLDSLSKIGNADVDARIAQGLAYALRAIAKDADKFLTESFRLKEAEHALEKAHGREAA